MGKKHYTLIKAGEKFIMKNNITITCMGVNSSKKHGLTIIAMHPSGWGFKHYAISDIKKRV